MKLPNIGSAIADKLISIGVDTPEKLKMVGTEEAFFKEFQRSGWQKGMCSCYLYALEGALTGVPWNKIPQKRKTELLGYVHNLRASFSEK